MNCPACKKQNISRVDLEPGLQAIRCEDCGGHWIPASNYEAWRRSLSGAIPEQPAATPTLAVADSREVKLCPDCGRILLRCRVGHGLAFHVERCSSCGGSWLDRNEWEALRACGLHDDLHRMFSSAWQTEVRAEEMRVKMEQIYQKRFGIETYQKLKEFRAWVYSHPEKRALIAFLIDENPFGVGKGKTAE